jgi:hypothetical protein
MKQGRREKKCRKKGTVERRVKRRIERRKGGWWRQDG